MTPSRGTVLIINSLSFSLPRTHRNKRTSSTSAGPCCKNTPRSHRWWYVCASRSAGLTPTHAADVAANVHSLNDRSTTTCSPRSSSRTHAGSSSINILFYRDRSRSVVVAWSAMRNNFLNVFVSSTMKAHVLSTISQRQNLESVHIGGDPDPVNNIKVRRARRPSNNRHQALLTHDETCPPSKAYVSLKGFTSIWVRARAGSLSRQASDRVLIRSCAGFDLLSGALR